MENLSTLFEDASHELEDVKPSVSPIPEEPFSAVKMPLQSPRLMGCDPVPYLVQVSYQLPVQCPAPALFSLPVPYLRVQFPSPLPLSL